MRVLIVYAHPEPQSFNSSCLSVSLDVFRGGGHEVVVSDLYAQRFNPVAGPDDVISRKNDKYFSLGEEQMHASTNALFTPELSTEIGRLLRADLLILQFPMWWFGMPAMLKGWIDRVFAFGSAYDFGQTWEEGVFTGRKAMLSVSTSAPAQAFCPRRAQRRHRAHPLAHTCRHTRYRRLHGAAAVRCPWYPLCRRGCDECRTGPVSRHARVRRDGRAAAFPQGRGVRETTGCARGSSRQRPASIVARDCT